MILCTSFPLMWQMLLAIAQFQGMWTLIKGVMHKYSYVRQQTLFWVELDKMIHPIYAVKNRPRSLK